MARAGTGGDAYLGSQAGCSGVGWGVVGGNRSQQKKIDELWTEVERLAFEVKLIKGKPDTGPIGAKMEQVKAKLKEMDVELAAKIRPFLPPGELIDRVASHFNIDEINQLAFDLGLEPENLTGERRIDRAHALVATLHREVRVMELVAMLKEVRPNVEWPEFG